MKFQIPNPKSQTTFGICLVIGAWFLGFFAVEAAANMRSSDYELQMPNLNFSAGMTSSNDYKLGFTGGQMAPGEYSRNGFKVLAGFWYLKTIIPFSFSISNQIIDFGPLSAGVPKTATTNLTVSAGGAGGYQVTAEENHQLMVPTTGAIIADTTGDNGDINESNFGTWEQNTTYGFGYTLYGNDVPSPFPTAAPAGNQFKQFTDISKGETPQVVMLSDQVGKNRIATVTYKINTSASQAAGRYHNVITYIATPTY
ncbi:MAG TPA: hypothetical protein VMW04_01265 [Patescibacteria group bacterium]|nr:hypothetical protein [Patescibacteria group bacterium]